MALENYFVKQIDYKTAMNIIVEKHYLHRKAPCSIAFGLFHGIGGGCNMLLGVICYGTPSSSSLRKGIAGEENTHNVIELTRLWVDDCVPRNGESFLIGRTLSLCGKPIVVSYAEIQQGHIGTVYQATNWLYTGLSAKRTNWTVEGIDKHCQTLADKYTVAEIKEKYGDKFTLVDRPRKHRYVFINAKGKKKKQFLSQLKYKTYPYPKIETVQNTITKEVVCVEH
jgi:hypothetical protein